MMANKVKWALLEATAHRQFRHVGSPFELESFKMGHDNRD